MENEQYLTVTALTKYIKFKFDHDIHLQEVLLTGEISNFKHHARGHFYFTLKDDNAQISACMFSRDASKVLFKPEDGMKVFVKGRIAVYESTGSYQIYVTEMRSDGIGDLYLRYEQLKKELEAEGFFKQEHKREIKRIPSTIGVITSDTGAAIRDIINTVSRRFPFVNLILYPALVQGIEAKNSIVKQIAKANADNLCDTLIVGRGGGSIEDLWAFNERIVAEAIYNSKIPIISAVGHEIDFTIADFVADKRAATPTAGAELATPDINKLKDEVLFNARIMHKNISNMIDGFKQRLIHIDQRIETSSPVAKINQKKRDLRGQIKSLNLNMNNIIYNIRQYLDSKYDKVKTSSPLNLIKVKRKELKTNIKLLSTSIDTIIINKRHDFKLQKEKLEVLNPLSIMDKGYSIPIVDGRAIKSVNEIKKDDIVTIKMKDGTFKSKVMEVTADGKE